jgi:hypothetical protein
VFRIHTFKGMSKETVKKLYELVFLFRVREKTSLLCVRRILSIWAICDKNWCFRDIFRSVDIGSNQTTADTAKRNCDILFVFVGERVVVDNVKVTDLIRHDFLFLLFSSPANATLVLKAFLAKTASKAKYYRGQRRSIVLQARHEELSRTRLTKRFSILQCRSVPAKLRATNFP